MALLDSYPDSNRVKPPIACSLYLDSEAADGLILRCAFLASDNAPPFGLFFFGVITVAA
jgi:hypothetical protein